MMPNSFQIPCDYHEVEEVYGKFSYTYANDTTADIIVARDWVSRNIVIVVDPPGYKGTVQVHRLLVDALKEALQAAIAACPTYEIHSLVGFVARHKMHDRRKGLSLHSWGAAVDVNPKTNAYGTPGDLPREYWDAFEATGALWGGHFRGASDPMHVQWAYRV